MHKWFLFALTGAFLAAVVQVMTKRALHAIDVSIGVTVQSVAMLLTLATITTVTGSWPEATKAPRWALLLVAGSGITAGVAWYFGYRALKLSEVAKATTIDRLSLPIAVILAMVFLRERPSMLNMGGIVLMVAGAIMVSQSNGK